MLSYSCFCYMFFFLFFGAMKSFIKVHFLIFYNNSAWIHWGLLLLLLFTAVNFRHLPEFELVGIPLSVNQNRPKPSPLAGSFFFVWLGKRICVSLSVNTLHFPLSYPTAPQIPLFPCSFSWTVLPQHQRLAVVLWYEDCFLGLEVFCFLFLNLLLKFCRYFSSNNAYGSFLGIVLCCYHSCFMLLFFLESWIV